MHISSQSLWFEEVVRMRQKDEIGLYARPSRETRCGAAHVIFRFAFSALVFLSLTELLITVSGFEQLRMGLILLLASGLLLCGAFAAASYFRRENVLVPVLLALLLLVCVFCRNQMMNGFGTAWNEMRSLWASAKGVLLPMANAEGQSGVWLVGCLLGCLLAAASYLLVKHAPAVCAALLMVLTVAACLFRAGPWLAIPAVASVLLLAAHSGQRRQSIVSLLSCVVFSALVIAVLVLFVPSSAVQGLSDQSMESIHHWRYERGQEILPEGDLSQPLPNSDSDAAILKVTSDTAQTLYLRGFVGDTYEKERWATLSSEAAAQEKDLFYWLHQSGFYPQSQLALAARQMGGFETGTVRVQNVAGCSMYRYAPCTILPEAAGTQKNTLQPSDTRTSGWNGERSYSYLTLTHIQTVLPALLDFLQTDQSAQTSAYLQAESAYRAFVRSYALEVPAEFRAQLGAVLDDCCSQYGAADSLTKEEAQVSALAFLEQCFGTDRYASLPLEDTAPGTQYQYATVAALALRYYGIPARYVEGYVVSVNENEVTDVDAACAGAWVEVYQDGVGWLPLELTPGLESLSAEQTEDGIKPVGTDADGEGDGLRVTEGQTPQEELDAQDDQTQEDQPKGGQRTGLVTKPAFWILLLAALLLLLIAAMVLRRYLILRKRRESFTQADRSAAVGCLFADAAALLEPLGLRRGCGSMLALCGPAGEHLGTAYGEELREMVMLNAQSLFSSHTPDEAQLARMTRFHEQTRKELLAHTKFLKKIQLQWLKCLF